MSWSIHVREYCAQAPPQEMSPRLKSVPTRRSSRRSSWCSDTTSHRWIVGLVALAILARTWGGHKSIYLWVYTDYQITKSIYKCQMSTLQTKSSRSAWQVKSMERRKRASFCTTEMQRSCDSVKGRGSTSGASLAVADSVSNVERGHSAVRRRRIRSLKCWKKEGG